AITAYRAGSVVIMLPTVVASSAWVLAQLGEAGGAQDRLREGEELLAREAARGIGAHHGWALCALGRARLALGRPAAGRRLAERAIEFSPQHPGFVAHALHLAGDVATHPDGLEPGLGEARYRDALALAEPWRMRPLVAHCHLGLGGVFRRMGDEARAE